MKRRLEVGIFIILFFTFSLTGESVYTETLNNFTGQYTKAIELTSEAKGVYTLQINSENGGINKKIVLQ